MSRKPTLWEQFWLAQDQKCATCSKEIALNDSAKRGCSFNIICEECYDKEDESFDVIYYDEFELTTKGVWLN